LVQALGDNELADRLGRAKRELLFGGGRSDDNRKAEVDEAIVAQPTNAESPTKQEPAVSLYKSPAPTEEQGQSQVDLVLIGCVKTKREGRYPAKDLFISPLFIGRRARAEALGAPWFILSAKFGLLAPEHEVETYDVSLNNASTAERRTWSARVLDKLQEQFG